MIPDPIGVVWIAKQFVVSEKERVRQFPFFLDLRIGEPYGATQRQRELVRTLKACRRVPACSYR